MRMVCSHCEKSENYDSSENGPIHLFCRWLNRLYAIVLNSLHACAILKGDCIEFATAARAYSLSALST